MKTTRKNLIPVVPIGKGFLVEYISKEKTKSGIIVPGGVNDTDEKDFAGYLVLSIGDLVTEIEPGDTVMIRPGSFQKASAYQFNIDFKTVGLVLFNEYDVFAIRKDIPVVNEYKWQSEISADIVPKI